MKTHRPNGWLNQLLQNLFQLLFKQLKDKGLKTIGSHPFPTAMAKQDPYGIAKRPLPSGDELEQLLPVQVGAFRRKVIQPFEDKHKDPIYTEYLAGNTEIFFELGICSTSEEAKEGLLTAKSQVEAEFPASKNRNLFIEDTDFNWYQAWIGNGALFTWTRGNYYFSAHAKGGEAGLNAFMHAFPY